MIAIDTAPTWRGKAACRTAPPEIFFPDGDDWKAEGQAVARDWCDDCPVRLDCLTWARETRVPYGVWGGNLFGAKAHAS